MSGRGVSWVESMSVKSSACLPRTGATTTTERSVTAHDSSKLLRPTETSRLLTVRRSLSFDAADCDHLDADDFPEILNDGTGLHASEAAEDEWERDCRLQAELFDDNPMDLIAVPINWSVPPPPFAVAKKFDGPRPPRHGLQERRERSWLLRDAPYPTVAGCWVGHP